MTGFEYVLPVIRGIQAEQEYYVTMCPLGILPKLFPLPNYTLEPQQRTQRRINKSRINKIANYVLKNPQDYVFGSITATIDADIIFEPLGEVAEERKLGRLRIPMDGSLTINDGLHRRVALEVALRENPSLCYETIAVVLFIDTGLHRSQQIFCDLNRWGVTLPSSLTLLYDHRDQYGLVTQAIVKQVSLLQRLIYLEGNTIPKNSDKLFTLNSLY